MRRRQVRTAIAHTRAVRKGRSRLIELFGRFGDAPDPAGDAVVAEQIATRLDLQADYLEASRLARALTFQPTPADLRREAAEWRRTAQVLRNAANDGPEDPQGGDTRA